MIKNDIVIYFILCCALGFGQSTINGIVLDEARVPVFAANVYLKSDTTIGSTTDFDGKFSLPVSILSKKGDTLIVSSIGYETTYRKIESLLKDEVNIIIINTAESQLEEVLLNYKSPISEQFSVNKLEKLDIYLDPISNGDPLKAITGLASSTNVSENSSPALRGSSASRSLVVLNGVPVANPIKNSQVNSVGSFSLFNTELIDKQYVYASNPPLTYGNSSAGLIEIESINSLKENQLSLSAGLANLGFFLSQKTTEENFIQLYGNWQFSKLFTNLNTSGFEAINYFKNKDIGVNYHHKINEDTSFNVFNYIIEESYSAEQQSFTYLGTQETSNTRYFNVLNFKKKYDKGYLTINGGVDLAKRKFNFGNINSEVKEEQFYAAVNYKNKIFDGNTLQIGATSTYNSYDFKSTIPEFFFAQAPTAPLLNIGDKISNHVSEVYVYDTQKISDKLTGSVGGRINIPTTNQSTNVSYQFNLRYNLNSEHSFLLSSGKYYNYSLPVFFNTNYNLLKSYQAALDYAFTKRDYAINAAVYYKNEGGDLVTSEFVTFDKTRIFGVECAVEYFINDAFKVAVSNTIIDKNIRVSNRFVSAADDLNYFIKGTVSYTNPKYVNVAFSYVGRSGTQFTPIETSTFNTSANAFSPEYANGVNSESLNNYNSINVTFNKVFKVKDNALISYFSINNIFDSENQRSRLYSEDYSSFTFDYLQPFTMYFGVMYKL